jgi:tetratricopeptide (TPR) repeat protein
MEFLREVANFLEAEDIKLLRIFMRDDVTSASIIRIFEDPENAGKYLVLLKDRPKAIYIVAKIAERIEEYLKGDEASISYELFMKALEEIKDTKDSALKLKIHLLVRDAIIRKINEKEYETAAALTSEFYEFGLKDCLKKLLLIASELSERGDYPKSVKILNLLIPSDSINELKSHILEEWGKNLMAKRDYINAASRFLEAIRVGNRKEVLINLGDAYFRAGEFENAYEAYSSIEITAKNEIEVLRRTSMMLNSWGEELVNQGELEKAVDKFNEAYQTAIKINEDDIAVNALKSARKAIEMIKGAD